MNLTDLQAEVGRWARANFGTQATTFLGCELLSKEGRTLDIGQEGYRRVHLESLAPLLGVVEEVCEWYEAHSILTTSPKDLTGKLENDVFDAIGDIAIYLCDYAEREHFPLERTVAITSVPEFVYPMQGVLHGVGKIVHATLKRHQKIRGMDNKDKYEQARNFGVTELWRSLEKATGGSILGIANDTWEKVIKKRDWKKDPSAGGGYTHLSNPSSEVSMAKELFNIHEAETIEITEVQKGAGSFSEFIPDRMTEGEMPPTVVTIEPANTPQQLKAMEEYAKMFGQEQGRPFKEGDYVRSKKVDAPVLKVVSTDEEGAVCEWKVSEGTYTQKIRFKDLEHIN